METQTVLNEQSRDSVRGHVEHCVHVQRELFERRADALNNLRSFAFTAAADAIHRQVVLTR